MIIVSGKNQKEQLSWGEFYAQIEYDKSSHKKDVLTGFCDFISLGQIIKYLACKEAGGIPVFLSHPCVKTSKNVFAARLENWKKLGIKNFISPYINEKNDETIENPGVSFVQLSSGTTANQKGFGISDIKLKRQIEEYAKVCGITKDSVVVSWLPVYHDMGLITSIFLPYIIGCKVVIIPTFDWLGNYDLLFKEINEHGGTHCWLPNFCFEVLTNSKEDLATQCKFINCSETCRKSSMDKFISRHPKAEIACCYALAENVFAVSQADYDGEVSCGPPINGTTVRIGENNEVFIGGDCLFDAMLVDGKFVLQAGEYGTGDVGEITDGKLNIVGRIKEIAKLHGKQIFLPDVDKEINDQTNVHKGRVVSLGIEGQGTQKLVVLYEASTDEDRKIRQVITQNFEVVSEVLRVPDGLLKKTSSGKLSRTENEKVYLELITLLKICSDAAGATIALDTPMKSDGLLDSFTVMEVLNNVSFKLKRPINWQFDFANLDTPLSFMEALK
jgi:acyl-CoA synthetase (AMP-forming)/AMP-acid ligase II